MRCADDSRRPKRYFPFAEGPRSCVGQSLAKVSLVATMATLLSRFSFRLADEVSPAQRGLPCWAAHGTRHPAATCTPLGLKQCLQVSFAQTYVPLSLKQCLRVSYAPLDTYVPFESQIVLARSVLVLLLVLEDICCPQGTRI